MNKSNAVAVENVALGNEDKTANLVTFPKIKMKLKHKEERDWKANKPADVLVMKQILKMAKEVAISNRQRANTNPSDGVENLIHGTVTSDCHCSALYPHHSYTFDACVHDADDVAVEQFDIVIHMYPNSGKKRKADSLKARYFEAYNQYQEITESLDIDSPLYEELSGKHWAAEEGYESLRRIERSSDEIGYISGKDLEEYEDIIERFEEMVADLEDAMSGLEEQPGMDI